MKKTPSLHFARPPGIEKNREATIIVMADSLANHRVEVCQYKNKVISNKVSRKIRLRQSCNRHLDAPICKVQ